MNKDICLLNRFLYKIIEHRENKNDCHKRILIFDFKLFNVIKKKEKAKEDCNKIHYKNTLSNKLEGPYIHTHTHTNL